MANINDDEDDHEFPDSEDDEGDDDDDEDTLDTFPLDGFTLSGMECLNEKCIMSATFLRNADGNSLEVTYAITAHTQDILSAAFTRFHSDEAYLTLFDDDHTRKSVLIMSDLTLEELQLRCDEDCAEESMYVYLCYKMKSFEQKMKGF